MQHTSSGRPTPSFLRIVSRCAQSNSRNQNKKKVEKNEKKTEKKGAKPNVYTAL
jgi:hypothetical protein